MSLESTLWLVLVAFMIHDFEEIVFLPRWCGALPSSARRRIPPFMLRSLPSTAAQGSEGFAFQVWILFALIALSVLGCVELHLYTLIAAMALIAAAHGVGHCVQALVLRSYIPAVATAIPATAYWIYAVYALAARGLVRWEFLPWACLGVLAVGLPAFIGVKLLANRVFKQSGESKSEARPRG
jgi:hypothetical protein